MGVGRRAMDRRGICEQQRGIGDTMREASAGSREASALDWQGIGGLSGKAPARDRRAAAMGPRGERGGAALQPAIRVEISVEPERGPKKKISPFSKISSRAEPHGNTDHLSSGIFFFPTV